MTSLPRKLEALETRDLVLVSESSDINGPESRTSERLLDELATHAYENLEVKIEPDAETFWCFMNPLGRPSFTPSVLRDITRMQHSVKRMFEAEGRRGEPPFRYFVFASRTPGIYNLGGDLGFFIDHIRKGDRAAMIRYAHYAIEAVYRNSAAFHVPVVTIALVQGDALGGGFECAMSLNLLVAEKSAKMGLPEILFNLFPGMGAYSFLSRRLDVQRTEQLITSGCIYTAAELHEMGIVDVLAEDGCGESAVRDYIASHRRRWNAHYAMFQARQRVRPVTLDELRDVVDIWVDAALRLPEPDLRKMERLVASQDRRMASLRRAPEAAVA
ncbi:MAG: crotonase/enoyl-CoA hydratase family protein [Rhodospirillales bacterium]|nr:crotonase/enoyl-CoA hydratase family protein [Rhodospirillales bacterium]